MFYKVLLDGNNIILNTFQLQQPTKTVPLWMVTGGEGINFYSSEQSKTPTKDIDAKLLFTGDYTVPRSFFLPENVPANINHLRKLIQTNYPGILDPPPQFGAGFDFSNQRMNELTQDINNLKNNDWEPYATNNGNSPQNNKVWLSGFNTRGSILWACMNGLNTSDGNLLYLDSSGSATTSLNFSDINAHIQSTTLDFHSLSLDLGDGQGNITRQFKIYIVKTPYLHIGRPSDAFPYTGQDADGGLQGFRQTDDNELMQIQNRLDFLHGMNQTDKMTVWQTYYTAISFMNLRRYLMSLVGVAILIDSNGQKYMLQEGVLDLFLDFTAGDVKGGKIYYENKLSDGMIPNILKKVDYCGKSGYIRVPTLNWLIYDQTRMLYHSLRLQQVGHHGWTDEGVDPYQGWIGFEDGKQGKYFSKLKGMLNTYLDVINRVEQSYDTDKANIVQSLQQCTDETLCSPSMFISYLYENIFPTEFVTQQAQISNGVCNIVVGGKKRGKTRRRKNKSTRKKRQSNKTKAKGKGKNKSKK